MEYFLAKKRLLSFLLAVVMLVSTAAPACADVFMFITVEEEQEPVYTDGVLSMEYDGYEVSVSYDADALLPEGTELHLLEILEGTLQYDEYFEAVQNTISEYEETVFVRFFDLTLTDISGEKVEPAVPVAVNIRAEELADAMMVSVLHFPDDEAKSSEAENFKYGKAQNDSFDVTVEDGAVTVSFEDIEPEFLTERRRSLPVDIPAEGVGRVTEDTFAMQSEYDDEIEGDSTVFLAASEPDAETLPFEIIPAEVTEYGEISFFANGFSVYGLLGLRSTVGNFTIELDDPTDGVAYRPGETVTARVTYTNRTSANLEKNKWSISASIPSEYGNIDHSGDITQADGLKRNGTTNELTYTIELSENISAETQVPLSMEVKSNGTSVDSGAMNFTVKPYTGIILTDGEAVSTKREIKSGLLNASFDLKNYNATAGTYDGVITVKKNGTEISSYTLSPDTINGTVEGSAETTLDNISCQLDSMPEPGDTYQMILTLTDEESNVSSKTVNFTYIDTGITKAAGADSSSVDLASRTDNKTGETYYVTACINTDKSSYKPGDTVTVTMILANTDPKNGVSGKNIMQYLEFSFYKGNTPLAENTFSFGKVDLGADSELSRTFTYTIPQNAADEDTELKMTVRSTSNNINWNPFTSLMTDNTAQCSTPLIIKAPESVYVESASNNGSSFTPNADGTLNVAFDLKNYQTTYRDFTYSLKVEAAESMGGAKTDITSGLDGTFVWTDMPGIASETATAASGSGTMPAANNGPAEAQAAVQTTLSDSLYGSYNAFYVTLTLTDTATGETSAQTAVVPRFRLDLSNYTFRFRDDTAGNSIPNYVSRTGLDWLDTLYYGLVAADDDVPFNNAEEFKTFLASQPDEATANSVLQKYIYDLYEPHVGVSGNYGDTNLNWPKDGNSPFHVQPTSQVNPMGTYTLADGGINYGDEYFKNSNKTAAVSEEAGAGDRAYQLDLSTETDPHPTNPEVFVIMVPTMWQMFDEAHATAQKGGETAVGSILTSVDEMAYLYDIKHALIRFAEYLKDQGSNAGVAIVNTQHGGDYSMIQGNKKSGGYFTTDMDQLIEAIEGWDAYGDCEHVHWSQDQLNNAMASIPNTFAGWTDADGNPVSIDSVVKNMVVIAGPTENTNGTNGYGSKLTEGKYGNVDYVWGIRTDTGTTQVSIGGRPIYSWLDTEANQNTIKANNPHYTEMDDPDNPAYQICTSEDAIYEQLVNIFNYEKSATSTVKGTVENVTLEDIVTKEFSVESAVVTVTYLDDDGNSTGVVDTITMTDESKGRIILVENQDGTTTVKGVVNKIEGRAVVDMKINIEAREDFVGSNNVKTNSGTPKVSYEHGDEEYSEDFDDEPKVNVPIRFEVPDGLTVTVNAGETVDVDGDLPYLAEDKSETIVQDVLDLFDKGYQVNGRLIIQWYDEDGQPVPGTAPSTCRVDDGKLERDANDDYVIGIPDFDCPTDLSDVGARKTYRLRVTFEPDPAVEGSVGTEVLTHYDDGEVRINVSTGGAPPDPFDPGEPPEPYVPDLDPTLSKQIDYLGDNDGTTDAKNPDTTLDDNGVAGLEDLYRLYLNLQADSEGVDLVLVLDESNSMNGVDMENDAGEPISRKEAVLSFLNGEDGQGTGFIRDFLIANPLNRISVAGFSSTGKIELGWTDAGDPDITVDYTLPMGNTSYSDGLYWADQLLQQRGDSSNQALVIFMGDGANNYSYRDGRMHNGNDDGCLLHGTSSDSSNPWPNVRAMLSSIYYYVTEGTYSKYTRNMNPDDFYQEYLSNRAYDPYLYADRTYSAAGGSFMDLYLLRDLQLDIPGFEAPNQITDRQAFIDFYQREIVQSGLYYSTSNDYERQIAFVQSISGVWPPARHWDLWHLVESAFLEFAGRNSNAVVHSIGFSGELNGTVTDANGVERRKDEVLSFFASYGGGQYHPALTAQELADEIYSICFMVNTKITDTLSAYVEAADDPELKVVQKEADGINEVVLYQNGALTEEGAEILQSVSLDPDTRKIDVVFKPKHAINPAYIYTASFNVQLTPEIYTQFVSGGNSYPNVGDPGTDYGSNETSSGQEGFLSNTEAKVTWTAGGHPDEKDFDKPVVQVHLADIIVKKVNENNNFIPGASFTLYDSAGMVEEFTVSEAEGVKIRDLRSGDYRLVETHSPAGYVILNKAIEFHISAGGAAAIVSWETNPSNAAISSSNTNDPKCDVIIVTNTAGIELPATGARGAAAYTVAGIAMLTAVGMILRERKRRDE